MAFTKPIIGHVWISLLTCRAESLPRWPSGVANFKIGRRKTPPVFPLDAITIAGPGRQA